MDGIPKALDVMKEYHLMRDDLTNITELVHWPKSKDLFKNVDARVRKYKVKGKLFSVL